MSGAEGAAQGCVYARAVSSVRSRCSAHREYIFVSQYVLHEEKLEIAPDGDMVWSAETRNREREMGRWSWGRDGAVKNDEREDAPGRWHQSERPYSSALLKHKYFMD